jgi:hypothetical protein
VYIVSANGAFNGPAVGDLFSRSLDEDGVAYYTNSTADYRTRVGSDFVTLDTTPFNEETYKAWDYTYVAPLIMPVQFESGDNMGFALGSCIIDYVPVTNSTRFLSPVAVTNAANYLIQQHTAAVASADTLGHIKVGSGLAIDGGGVLSATGGATDFDIHSSWKLAPSVGNSFYNAALSLGGIALAANSLTSTAYWAVTPSTNKYTMVAIRAEFNSPGSSETRTRFVYRSPTSMSTNVTVLTTGAISSGVYRFVLPPYYGAHIPGAQIMTVTGRPSTHVTQLGFTVMYRVATDAEAATYVAP